MVTPAAVVPAGAGLSSQRAPGRLTPMPWEAGPPDEFLRSYWFFLYALKMTLPVNAITLNFKLLIISPTGGKTGDGIKIQKSYNV